MTSGARRELRSYGGDRACAIVHTPRNVDELRLLLKGVRERGARVTFRGGGCAFDTQALNDDVVIEMTAMKAIAIDPARATVTAESGATWGDIVRVAQPHGLVPGSLVTTREATIAGTASSDCLGRFSPTCGKEGASIVSFDLLTALGELLHCTRTQNADVFFAAIGGFGYLGAILRVTYRLQRIGYAPRVETVVTPYRSLRDFIAALIPRGSGLEGLYGAFLGAKALHFRSRYVEPHRRRSPLWLLHQPRSIVRALVDLLIRIQVFNRIGSWLTFNLTSRGPRTYVDGFEDYAFFMDGNALAKSIGQAFGAPMRMIQQTFVIPADLPEEGQRDEAALRRCTERALAFIGALAADLRAEGIQPTMFDCLYLPKDEGFLLSATRDRDGFALSAAFDTSSEEILAKVRRILTVASSRCRTAGGRVHLVKNVCAAPDDIAAMYREGASAFFDLKRRLDPGGILRNEFLERLFPNALHGATSPVAEVA